MALTKFDICSQALIKCGSDTISSFNDGTHEANVCSVMYDTIKKSLLYYTFQDHYYYLFLWMDNN